MVAAGGLSAAKRFATHPSAAVRKAAVRGVLLNVCLTPSLRLPALRALTGILPAAFAWPGLFFGTRRWHLAGPLLVAGSFVAVAGVA